MLVGASVAFTLGLACAVPLAAFAAAAALTLSRWDALVLVVAVWLASTLGMVLADGLAILAGTVLGTQLPATLMRYGAAIIFGVTGVVTLLSVLVSRARFPELRRL